MAKSPIQGTDPFILMDRRKGDPINSHFFKVVKDELARAKRTGLNYKQIAILHNVGLSTVSLIDRVPNFYAYQELRNEKSTWISRHAHKYELPKPPSLLARIFKRK